MTTKTLKEQFTSELFATDKSLNNSYWKHVKNLGSEEIVTFHIFLNTLFKELDKEKLYD